MERKLRILLVDDETDLLVMAERMFAVIGEIESRSATSGSQALSIIESFPPDVIITDLLMPGMTGEQLIRHLRANPRTEKIPVILMTSIPDVGDALQISDVTILPKPFDPFELNALVKQLAGG